MTFAISEYSYCSRQATSWPCIVRLPQWRHFSRVSLRAAALSLCCLLFVSAAAPIAASSSAVNGASVNGAAAHDAADSAAAAVPISDEKFPDGASADVAARMSSLLSFLRTSLLTALRGPDATGDDTTGFVGAFTQSLLLILACELGDRTFFVAAILAMKASRIVVFAGAISALGLMTVLSALIGKAFPMILDKKYTSLAAAFLFAYFGIQLLRDWWSMRKQESAASDELAEVEEELDDEKHPRKAYSRNYLLAVLSPVFIKAFTMTGLAEWGDRSQIATIALAAAQDIYGVILGGIVGHAFCTSLAVLGGRLLASRISEKAVALTGGILFISFALLTAFGKLE